MTTATVNGTPTQVSQIASFNISSGAPNWTYQVTPGSQLSLIAAADGNGLGGKATDQSGNDTVIRFDSSGNPSFDTWVSGSVSNVNFFVADDLWVGTTAAGSEGEYFAAPVELSTSSWPEEGGQEQGAANSDLTVTNFSQAAPNQTTIQTVMQGIIAALPNNAQCNNWLQAGPKGVGSGLQQMQAVLAANTFGHGIVNQYGAVNYRTAAFSGLRNPDGTLVAQHTNAVFIVNDNGAFFNQFQNGDPTKPLTTGKRNYPGNSLRAQATILIHEAAHQIAVAGFQPDFGNPEAGKANDKMVDTNCKQLIEGLK